MKSLMPTSSEPANVSLPSSHLFATPFLETKPSVCQPVESFKRTRPLSPSQYQQSKRIQRESNETSSNPFDKYDRGNNKTGEKETKGERTQTSARIDLDAYAEKILKTETSGDTFCSEETTLRSSTSASLPAHPPFVSSSFLANSWPPGPPSSLLSHDSLGSQRTPLTYYSMPSSPSYPSQSSFPHHSYPGLPYYSPSQMNSSPYLINPSSASGYCPPTSQSLYTLHPYATPTLQQQHPKQQQGYIGSNLNPQKDPMPSFSTSFLPSSSQSNLSTSSRMSSQASIAQPTRSKNRYDLLYQSQVLSNKKHSERAEIEKSLSKAISDSKVAQSNRSKSISSVPPPSSLPSLFMNIPSNSSDSQKEMKVEPSKDSEDLPSQPPKSILSQAFSWLFPSPSSSSTHSSPPFSTSSSSSLPPSEDSSLPFLSSSPTFFSHHPSTSSPDHLHSPTLALSSPSSSFPPSPPLPSSSLLPPPLSSTSHSSSSLSSTSQDSSFSNSRMKPTEAQSTAKPSKEKEIYTSTYLASECVNCPVYTPSIEEFSNPFQFLHSRREEIEKAGFCIITPPVINSMSPAQLRDHFMTSLFNNLVNNCAGKELQFKTKVQNVHQLMNRYNGPAEKFITHLYLFAQKRQIDLGNRLPHIGDHVVDLYRLYSAVSSLGGFEKVSYQNKWDLVVGQMRISPYLNMNLQNAVKAIYKKFLLQFETWDAEQQHKGTKSILEQVLLDQNQNDNPMFFGNEFYVDQSHVRARCWSREGASDQEVSDWQPDRTTQGKLLTPKFGYAPGKIFTLPEFEQYATEVKHGFFHNYINESCEPNDDAGKLVDISVEHLESEYWKLISDSEEYMETLYGSDVCTMSVKTSGYSQELSGIDPVSSLLTCPGWNQHVLPRVSGSAMGHILRGIPGITSPYIYVGMMFASFCWHTEDNYLYSINQVHFGAPKRWYVIPASHAEKFEELFAKLLPNVTRQNPDVLHHLVTQVPPNILIQNGIPVYTGLQRAGQIVITCPQAYHGGFNHGFNLAESVNLALPDWIPYCKLSSDHYRQQQPPHLPVIPLEEYFFQLIKDYSHDPLIMRYAIPQYVQILTEEIDNHLKLRQLGVTTWTEMKVRNGKMSIAHFSPLPTSCFVCLYDFYLSMVVCPQCTPTTHRGVCVSHCEQLCSCPLSTRIFIYRHAERELKQMVATAQKDLVTKYTGRDPTWLTGSEVRFHPLNEKCFSARRRKRVVK